MSPLPCPNPLYQGLELSHQKILTFCDLGTLNGLFLKNLWIFLEKFLTVTCYPVALFQSLSEQSIVKFANIFFWSSLLKLGTINRNALLCLEVETIIIISVIPPFIWNICHLAIKSPCSVTLIVVCGVRNLGCAILSILMVVSSKNNPDCAILAWWQGGSIYDLNTQCIVVIWLRGYSGVKTVMEGMG